MEILLDTPEAAVRVCDALPDILALREPLVEMALWPRAIPPAMAAALADLPAASLPDGRVLVRLDDLEAALDTLFLDRAATAALRPWLIADIATLAALFADLTGSIEIDVRLERITGDACWKFHRDCVEARLLTTYRGPGTEWVSPVDAAAALRDQKAYRGPLNRFPAQAVGVFKGSCAGPGSGIVHRSPSLAGRGETRLLLCLNLPSSASPERWTR